MASARYLWTTMLFSLVMLPSLSPAAVYTIANPTADAFLAAGSPNNPVGSNLASLNFGAAGTLAVAPASSLKGEFDSILKFNFADAVTQFNATFGTDNWQISGLTLNLASNFGVQGTQPPNTIFNPVHAGSFGLTWLSNDNWVEGAGEGMGTPGYPANSAVSFQSIPTLFSGPHAFLGTYTYTPPGNNVYVGYTLPLNAGLLTHAMAGGDVSLFFNAADNQISYLFNSRNFSQNHPELTVTATAVPEPSTLLLVAIPLAILVLFRQKTTLASA